MKKYVIVGGGIVGLALALELAQKIAKGCCEVVLITPENLQQPVENQPVANNNTKKIIALSDINYEFLLSLNLRLTPSQVNQIQMVDGKSSCCFIAHNVGLSCIGYCVSWQEIYVQLCRKVCEQSNIKIVSAKVDDLEALSLQYDHVFLCDGGNIQLTRLHYVEHDYQQQMLICRGIGAVKTSGTAYEFFTPYGALAILPYNEQMICLFAMSNKNAGDCLANPEQLHQIIKNYTSSHCDITFEDNDVATYPLKLRYVDKNPYQNITLMGNSAHTIHPILAQGLNLGLKNLQLLIKLMQYSPNDALPKYEKLSKANILQTVKFTHYLALYSNNHSKFSALSVGKELVWKIVNKVHPIQKLVFSFLQH